MSGDGNFGWWWGRGSDPVYYYGPFGTRDDATADAKATTAGAEDGGFTICEADKQLATPHFFDADAVIEQFGERNEECWGEDGCECNASREQKRELERMLGDTFQAWLAKIGSAAPRVWSFGEQRREEYVGPTCPTCGQPLDLPGGIEWDANDIAYHLGCGPKTRPPAVA